MGWNRRLASLGVVAGLLGSLLAGSAQAVPLFARQTGQTCAACHAGGQFPELTPFGRAFKLTGYTLGSRTVPLAAMAVVSASHVANTGKSDDPGLDFDKNGQAVLATLSLFTGGKITDNTGAFVQVTYDPYATRSDDGRYHGHTAMDNLDVRFADRTSVSSHDVLYGLSLNNNPSVSDPWNTAAAWMQYVPVPSPTSSRFIDGAAPYPSFSSGGNIAGLTGYTLVDDVWYAEFGAYGTASGPLHVLRAGVSAADSTQMRGLNPYVRLAWSPAWGDHHLMLGTSWMRARVYDDPLDTSDPASVHRYTDWHLDAQYQYLSDPHTITGQFVWGHNGHLYPAALAGQASAFVDASGAALPPSSASDSSHLWRAKLSYAYQARYGASLSLFSLQGAANTANQTSGFDPATLTITSDPGATAPSLRVGGSLNGKPDTAGSTLEVFWTPVEFLRVGAQYTAYTRYNGAGHNYDGFGRNASDNNSLFVYLWVSQ